MNTELDNLDPRIGILIRGGVPVCYVFVQGVLCEGTREQIENILGIKENQ